MFDGRVSRDKLDMFFNKEVEDVGDRFLKYRVSEGIRYSREIAGGVVFFLEGGWFKGVEV